MVDINYDEFTNSLVYPSDHGSLGVSRVDPMFRCYSEHFPERLSRLHLSASAELFASPVMRRPNRRSRDRYKTQPITFDEITEVDEDTTAAAAAAVAAAAQQPAAPGEQDHIRDSSTVEAKATFKTQMTGFSRSMDGLVSSCSGDGFKSSKLGGRDPGNTNASLGDDPRPAGVASQLSSSVDEDPSEGDNEPSVQPTDSPTSSLPKYGMTAFENNARRRRKYSLRNRRRAKNTMEEEDVALVEELVSNEESVHTK